MPRPAPFPARAGEKHEQAGETNHPTTQHIPLITPHPPPAPHPPYHERHPARPPVDRPEQPFYNAEILERDIGVRFKGVEKTNVAEYCVSEGWIRVEAGKGKDRFGNPLTIKLSGTVEPYFRDKS